MTELIEATVFRPIVEPYSEQELDNLPPVIARHIRLQKYQKLIGEEQLATIKTDNRHELKNRLIELYLKYQPYPILVKLNTNLNLTFIVDKVYDMRDPEAISESVLFTYNEKGKEIWDFITQKIGKGISKEDNKRIYAELSESFGIKGKFREDNELSHHNPYTTTESIKDREQEPLDLNTMMFQFIDERGRIISRNDSMGGPRSFPRVDTDRWLERWHPEMRSQGINGINNLVDTTAQYTVSF